MAKQSPGGGKFAELHQMKTAASHFGLTTADIIAKLTEWDKQYGIELSYVEPDAFTVTFARLPQDVSALAAEIHAFCPDIIQQNFNSFPDELAHPELFDPEDFEQDRLLAEGIDFNRPDYGMELLKKSLRTKRSQGFWWPPRE